MFTRAVLPFRSWMASCSAGIWHRPGPAEDPVGGGLFALREGLPLPGEQNLAGSGQLAGLAGRGIAGRSREAGYENAGPGGCRH
jgi:hypothetical protein